MERPKKKKRRCKLNNYLVKLDGETLERGDYHALMQLNPFRIEHFAVDEDNRITKLVLGQPLLVLGPIIPPSIKYLDRLLYLEVDSVELVELPDELWNLPNLIELSLNNCKKLKQVPDSIGSLTKLKSLDLFGCGITSLPKSIFALENLMVMFLGGTPMIVNNHHPTTFIWELVEKCPKLGHILRRRIFNPLPDNPVYPNNIKLQYSLSCNRARFRTRRNGGERIYISPSVWPLALQNATKLFSPYSAEESSWDLQQVNSGIDESNAIYRLIKYGMESFLLNMVYRG